MCSQEMRLSEAVRKPIKPDEPNTLIPPAPRGWRAEQQLPVNVERMAGSCQAYKTPQGGHLVTRTLTPPFDIEGGGARVSATGWSSLSGSAAGGGGLRIRSTGLRLPRMAGGRVDSGSMRKWLLGVGGSRDHRLDPKGLTTFTHRLLYCWLGLGGWSFIDTRLPPGSFGPPSSG